jgi:hypothetical protein
MRAVVGLFFVALWLVGSVHAHVLETSGNGVARLGGLGETTADDAGTLGASASRTVGSAFESTSRSSPAANRAARQDVPAQVARLAPGSLTSRNDPTRLTWIGGGADELWATGANWDAGRAPIPGDTLLFSEDFADRFYSAAAQADYTVAQIVVTSGQARVGINGNVTVTESVTISPPDSPFGGSVSGDGSLTVDGELTLSEGSLSTATVAVGGAVSWTGGSIGGDASAVTTFSGGGRFTAPGSGSAFSQDELVVRDRTLRLAGGTFEMTSGYIGLERGTLIVDAGATLRFTGDDESGVRPDGQQFAVGRIVNNGVIVKAGGAGLFDETWLGGRSENVFSGRNDFLDITGSGSFRSEVGTLALNLTNASTELTGLYEAEAGGRVRLSPVSPTASSVFVVTGTTRGGGNVEFNGPMRHEGTHDVTGFTSASTNDFSGLSVVFAETMDLVSLGALSVFGGIVEVQPPGSYALSSLSMSGVSLTLTPDVVVSGTTSLQQGVLLGSGTVQTNDLFWRAATIGSGGALTVTDSLTVDADFESEGGGTSRVLRRELNADGVTVWDEGSLLFDAGELRIGAGGDFQIQTDAAFRPTDGISDGGAIGVEGVFRTVGGPSVDVSVPISGSGVVEVGSGRFTFADTFGLDGTVRGTGTLGLGGDVSGAFTLAPGTDGTAGLLALAEPYSAAGRGLAVDLGGSARGTGYDALDVAGALTLGGTLRARTVGGFAAAAGERFVLAEAASVGGSFDALDVPEGFTVETTPTQVVLVAGSTGGTNAAPIAQDDAAETDEDTSVLVDVLANDTDPDDDALSIAEIVSAPTTGSAALEGNAVRFVPDADFFGNATFSYAVTDGALRDTAQVFVTVNPVNDAPQARDDVASTPFETLVTIDVLANDTDVEGSSLSIAGIVQAPARGEARIVDGAIDYQPAQGFSGADTLRYAVSDGALADTAAVVVTVAPPGNRPPVAVDDAAETDEDASVFVDVLANDTDPDGDALSIAEITTPPRSGQAIVDDGGIVYTPAPNFFGADTLAYRTTDGVLTSQARVVIRVRPINDAPVAVADTARTAAGAPVFVAVLSNDTDVDGDELSVEAVVEAPRSGRAELVEGGLRYTPETGFFGADTLAYRVTDGALASQTQVFVFVSPPVNAPPIVRNDTLETDEDVPLDLAAALANDTDPEGQPLALRVVEGPFFGAVATEGGATRYVPEANFNGLDSLRYVVTDGQLESADTAQVRIVVRPVNDAPVAADDAAETETGVPVTVDVLANDRDADGDALTAVLVQAPGFGTAEVVEGGIRYVPPAGFEGLDSLRYAATDPSGARDTAAVRIAVTGAAASPVARPDTFLVLPRPTTLDVLANDTDPDGQPLRLVSISPSEAGAELSLSGDTTVAYAPPSGFRGDDRFVYVVANASGLRDSAAVVVRVRSLRFDVVDLGDLGGGAARALAVSDAGVIVGASLTAEGTVASFAWSGGTIERLEVPGGLEQGAAYAVNPEGVIAGTGASAERSFAVRMGARAETLGGLGGRMASGYGVSANGTVVGSAADGSGTLRPAVWPAGSEQADLLSIGGAGEAYGVSSSGLAVGALVEGDGTQRAFAGERVLDGEARAYAVNDAGEVVGTLLDEGGGVPVVWRGGQVDVLGGGATGEALGINDAGWIVGTSSPPSAGKTDARAAWRARGAAPPADRWGSADLLRGGLSKGSELTGSSAFLFWNDGFVDLNALIPPDSGWQLVEARDVNESGVVVGWGLREGVARAFALVPTANTPPTASADAARTQPGQPVVIDVLANDRDADADELRVRAVLAPAAGAASLDARGHVVYTPADGFSGRDAFAYILTDGRGGLTRGHVDVDVEAPPPAQLVFERPRPNPAASHATLRFGLPQSGPVRLTLFDAQGRLVRTFGNRSFRAGTHALRVDLSGLPSGSYWCRIQTGDSAATQALLIVR